MDPSPSPAALSAARSTVIAFTAIASGTGAFPVPGASVAIVGETAVMIAKIAVDLGTPITVATVVKSFGVAGSLNVIGRTVFVEAARAMGWTTGPFGVAGVSALGATTAGMQTWVIGQLAIAIGQNGGAALGDEAARQVRSEATASYAEHVREGEKATH